MGPGPLWGLQPWALGPVLCPKDLMCSQAGGELPGELGPTLGDVLPSAGTQGHPVEAPLELAVSQSSHLLGRWSLPVGTMTGVGLPSAPKA